MKGKIFLLIVFLAAFMSAGGCVLKSKYDKLDLESRDLNREMIDLKKENDDIKSEILRVRAELSELENTNADLRRVNRGLADRNRMLSDEIADYRKKSMTLETELIKKDEKLDKLKDANKRITEDLKEEIARGQVIINELEGMLKVNVVSAVLFESGSHKILAGGRKILDKVADMLKNVKDRQIEIQGHTDNVKISGTLQNIYPSNWELSTARATSVLRYLEERGVPSQRLKAAGYGEHAPVAGNDTEQGRQKNRRIEIVLLPLIDPEKKSAQ